MIETPPRLWSARFREILWPALWGNVFKALEGLFWMLVRRRVRGWARLLVAASEAPDDYNYWIRRGEKRALANFCAFYSVKNDLRLFPIIITDQANDTAAVTKSLNALRVALGDNVKVYSGLKSPHLCRQLPVNACLSLSSVAAFIKKESAHGWLLPILPGDAVSPYLLEVLLHQPLAGASLVYWDEDSVGRKGREKPWIKPDWDENLFRTLGGLAGSGMISIAAAERSNMPFETKPDLEQALFRMGKAEAAQPIHIPFVLTHRGSKNTLESQVCHSQPQYEVAQESWPSVSVIIPTRDRADLLATCLRGLEQTNYPGQLELIVIDNGSIDPEALKILKNLKSKSQTVVIHDPSAFNYSRLNNAAVARAGGKFLCFLNNDVEATEQDWLSVLVTHAMAERAGAVGAMLLYPSGRIQHAGVVIGVGGAAGHVQKGVLPSDRRFWTWHAVTREVSALTAAVLVIEKSKFLSVSGFDEAFAVAFNDVDLCLRLKAAGFRNLYVANVQLIHRESESRGDDRSPKNSQRYDRELALLQRRWGTNDFEDPHFSPLFSKMVERCVLAP